MGQSTKWSCEHHCRHKHEFQREKITRRTKVLFYNSTIISVSPADFFVTSWISSNIACRHIFGVFFAAVFPTLLAFKLLL